MKVKIIDWLAKAVVLVSLAFCTWFLAASVGLAGEPTEYELVELAASAGDYQAQRNLAFGYASFPYPGQNKDPIRACGWYLIVYNSDHPEAHAGDLANVNLHCTALSSSELEQAKSIAYAHFDFWERHNYKGHLGPSQH